MIGVDPSRQGIGLGRALTVGGLASLARARDHRRACSTSTAPTTRRSASTARSASPRTASTARTECDVDAIRPMSDARSRGTARPGARSTRSSTSWGEPALPRAASSGRGSTRTARPLADITTLPAHAPRPARRRAAPALELVTEATATDDMTTKWLWACTRDGAQVETVLMRYPTRATVCVSSQAGCAMGCTFCATGQAGFERHLDAAEIVEQVHARRARLTAARPQRRLHGHGRAARELRRDVGRDRTTPRRRRDLGAPDHREHGRRRPRHPPPRARTTARSPSRSRCTRRPTTLRSELVPLNLRYPIAEVLDAAAEFAGARGRRITFEYACIAGVNDSLERGRGARAPPRRVPRPRRRAREPHSAQPDRRIRRRRHRARLGCRASPTGSAPTGVTATVRRNRGTDIAAACGQLRARERDPLGGPGSATMAP